MKQAYTLPLTLRWQLLFTNKFKMRVPLVGLILLLFFGFSFSIQAQITEFNYTGSVQTYTVPAGVTSLNVKLYGAQGGGSENCEAVNQIDDDGGKGGYAEGVLSVTPGQILNVYVGGKPGNNIGKNVATPGGFNGGGSAGQYGGGGGGASDVRINGAALANRVIVAGGGGGGNTGCPDHGTGGAGGGLVGVIGQGRNTPGAGGTQIAGGAPGSSGQAGQLGQGGETGGYHTAGGGGGYYGGGSAFAAGAGGGSSYLGGVTNGTTLPDVRIGNGLVQITVLQSTYYADADADGYGNAAVSVSALVQPVGYVLRAGDCNDNDATINPGATDLCDGIDRNCDGVVLAKPTVTLSANQTICSGQYANISLNLTGVAPWSITYTDGSGPVTINNIQGASAYMIPVNPAVTTTYSILALSDAYCKAASLPEPVVITVNQAPELTVPANITVATEAGRTGASVPFEATATGVPAPTISYTINGAAVTSPYFFPVGVTTVTAAATNSCNVDSETFTVTVEDKEAPMALAQNITVQLSAAGNLTIAAAAIDNGSSDASGIRSLVLSKTDFDCSNVGANEVVLTVTDNHGNVATATATVTVEDKMAPVVVAKNITVQLNAGGNISITADQVNDGSTDNCGIATVVLSKTDFDCSNVGNNEVTLTLTDNHGNVATATATVTVEDKVAPVAVAKNMTVQLNAAGSVTIAVADVNDGSTDNCGIASVALDKTTFDCSNIGANTITLTVTDNNGNTHTATAVVTVEDKMAPTLEAPVAVTVDVDAGKSTAANVALGTPVTTDNCGVTRVTNDAPAEFMTGTTTVTWTAEDAAGNTVTATQTVIVRTYITAYTRPATIQVPIRTTFSNIGLPTTVEVTYNNNTKENIPVMWNAGNYNGEVAGIYELTSTLTLAPGTTNQNNVEVKINVEVQPNKAPTALALNRNTFSPNIASTEAIGTFATTDADDAEHVYTLVKGQGDANNNLFEIRGNTLYLKSNEGLSGKTQFSIRVSTTDVYNNTFEQTFTLAKGAYAKAIADLKIVNTFTPNNDGINDEWTIPELKFYNQVEVEVFDRSGVRLFHTTDPEKGWDGRDQNGLVRKGSYLYEVQVKDINLVKKGVVSILKK